MKNPTRSIKTKTMMSVVHGFQATHSPTSHIQKVFTRSKGQPADSFRRQLAAIGAFQRKSCGSLMTTGEFGGAQLAKRGQASNGT
jgi:hypothetical protein